MKDGLKHVAIALDPEAREVDVKFGPARWNAAECA